MPIPGLNPLEKAPPPGSQNIAASAASVAQLYQRITALERRMQDAERPDVTYIDLNYTNPTYWTTYNTTPNPVGTPTNWGKFTIQRSGRWCSFNSLFKSVAGFTFNTPSTYQPMFNLPPGTRPGSSEIGLVAMVDSASQKYLGTAEIRTDGNVLMRNEAMGGGASNGQTAYGVFVFNPWIAVY
jgi:hypothetical protein